MMESSVGQDNYLLKIYTLHSNNMVLFLMRETLKVTKYDKDNLSRCFSVERSNR